MNQEGYVRSETHSQITTITFHHPLSNSLPASLLHALAQEIHQSSEDFNTRVIVLQSEGRVFCAGASFSELTALQNTESGKEFFSGFSQVINAMRKSQKLIIGRIHGKCVGGGVGIAAAVDYAIALDLAEIKLSELSLGFGPFVIAPAVERKIGVAAFSALSIDSTHWRSAEWALRKGLYAEVHTSVEALDEAVNRLADALSHNSPEAMAELKKILWKGTEHWDQLLSERASISGNLALADHAQKTIQAIQMKKK